MACRRSLSIALAAAALSVRPAIALQVDELVEDLRQGALTLYLRHAITDRSQRDRGVLGNRSAQRNLSSEGRAQARALGVAWRALNLPLGEVRTSPVFRALDTAELAFGAAVVDPDLTADDYTHDPALLAERIERLRARLHRPPARGNDVLVGHIVPLGMLLGRVLSQAEFPEGSAALFRSVSGEARLLGIVPAEALIRTASER